MFHLNIKNLTLASAVAICAAAPSLSHALPDADYGPFHPVLGFDLQQRNMKFKEGYGDNLWKETYPQTNIYAGMRFGSYLGIRVGHENSKTRNQTVRLSPGETFLGQVIPAGPANYINLRGSSDIKGTYAQIMGYLPFGFLDATELFLGVGAIHNKLHLEYQFLDGSGNRHYNKSDTHTKVEFGVQKLICNHVGFRVVGGWENTSSFKNLKSVEDPGAPSFVNLKDTWTVGTGFFWVF